MTLFTPPCFGEMQILSIVLFRVTTKTSRVLGILLGCKIVGNMIVSKKNGNFTKYASRVRSLKEMSLGDKLSELETLFKGKVSSFFKQE